jgi:hypothetical protein
MSEKVPTYDLIDRSDSLNESIIADFDKEGRLLSLEILNASQVIGCHFMERPLELKCVYSPQVDIFKLYFTSELNIGDNENIE